MDEKRGSEQARELEVAALVAAARLRGERREAERVAANRWTPSETRSLMGDREELGLTGMEWDGEGGYIVTREVRATEPWRASLVREGERPRVQLSTISRHCDRCGEPYKASRTSSRYCGATCRQAAKRFREAHGFEHPARVPEPIDGIEPTRSTFSADAFRPFSRDPLPIANPFPLRQRPVFAVSPAGVASWVAGYYR